MESYIAPDGSTRYRMTQSEYDRTYNVPIVPNSPVPPPELTQAFQDDLNRRAAMQQAPSNEFLRGLGGFPQGQSNLGSTVANTAGHLTRDIGIFGATIIVAIYLLRFLARILLVAIRLWGSFANTSAGTRLGGWWTKILRDE